MSRDNSVGRSQVRPWPMDVEGKEILTPAPRRGRIERLNDAVANTWFGNYFQLEQRNTAFTTELRAGLVCFLTICYIVAVNPAILSDTGGTCTTADCTGPNQGNPGCMFDGNAGWTQCISDTKNSLIAATSIAAMVASFCMGAIANMPLPLAPGMGINAYFTYNVVGFYGEGPLSYQGALAAVFVEGWIFMAISVSGARQKIACIVPRYIIFATACGIGMFLCFIGMQTSEGIGIIAGDGATLVTLGGCPIENRAHGYFMLPGDATYGNICGANSSLYLPPPSGGYTCKTNVVRSPTMWLGIAGGAIMVTLMCRDVPASILYGVLFVTIISWIPGHAASYLGADTQIPGGAARLAYFEKVVALPDVSKTAGKFDFNALKNAETWTYLITFLYLDFLDATSCMFTLARLMSETVPGFINERGIWPKQLHTMCMDGAAIVLGSCLGSSPLTVMAESSVAIREGGRTGITTMVIALGFGITMFFAPIFSNIPGYATGPALILVGALMVGEARHIEWTSVRVAFPSFITMIMMPLTYSIAYGVLSGLFCALTLWVFCSLLDCLDVALGRGKKTYRIIWLEAFQNVYLAFGKESVLIEELPGYIASSVIDAAESGGGHATDPAALVASLQKALAAAEAAAAAAGVPSKNSFTEDESVIVGSNKAGPSNAFNRKSKAPEY